MLHPEVNIVVNPVPLTLSPQLDEFKLDLGNQDLGELQKVDIGFSSKQSVLGALGGLGGKNWNLTSVEASEGGGEGVCSLS